MPLARPLARAGRAARAVTLALSAAVTLLAAACGDDHVTAPEWRVYEVMVGEQETFRIALANPQRVAEAEALLAAGTPRTVMGRVVPGDGGHNTGYSWHLDPATVEFVDATIEACSGRPRSDVEADVPYWVNVMRHYCPWSARIVARVE